MQYSIEQFRILCLVLLLVGVACTGYAQGRITWREIVWDSDFSTFDTAAFTLGLNSSHDAANGNIVLTPQLQGQSGRVFLMRNLRCDYFDASFRAWLGVNTPTTNTGGDGIVFAIAQKLNYPHVGGGSIGFDSSNGLGVEFDTFLNPQNNDPGDEHVAIVRDFTSNHLAAANLPRASLEDGQWHNMAIRMRNGTFDVTLDGTNRLTYAVPAFTPFDGFFGVTSGTGSAFNEHRVDDVLLSVPSRKSEPVRVHNLCDTSFVRSFSVEVVNNHPDAKPLFIDQVRMIELNGAGEFNVTHPALPVIVPVNDSIRLIVTFNVVQSGTRRAVLQIREGTGEVVEDTITVMLVSPRAAWDRTNVQFPVTLLGSASLDTIRLSNPSLFPVTIRMMESSNAAFQVLSPSVPFNIQPGEDIPVVVRFSPTSIGQSVSTVSITNSCGQFSDVTLLGFGDVSPLEITFTQPALMLRPNESGLVSAVLVTEPSYIPLNSLDAEIRYDLGIARFISATLSNRWPSNAALTSSEVNPGFIRIGIRSLQPISSSGNLFDLRFEAVTSDTGCTQVAWLLCTLNPDSPLPGVPASLTTDGRVCINPSCRVPDGLLRTVSVSNRPNPSSQTAIVEVVLEDDLHASIQLVNERGQAVLLLYEGHLTRGSYAYRVESHSLSSGLYYVYVRSRNGSAVHPLIIHR